MIDQAAIIVPMLDGPSARGTTSVQASVIVHVISCAPASTETLRPIFGAPSAGATGDGLIIASAEPSDMLGPPEACLAGGGSSRRLNVAEPRA